MAKNQKDTEPNVTAHELLEARVDALMSPAEDASADSVAASAPPLPGATKKSVATASIEMPAEVTAADEDAAQPNAIVIAPSTIDTPESDAAIDDIVAQEADTVLAADDAGIAAAAASAEPTEEPKKSGHPIFWFLILLIAVLAIIFAAVLVNPNLLP